MKRLISFLIAICLLIMPVVMAEDIELNNIINVDEDVEDIELDIGNIEDGIPEELEEIDLSDGLLIDDIISEEAIDSIDLSSNEEETTVGPDSDPESIRYVQEKLIAVHALPEGSVNGVYDDATRAAVEAFQQWVNEQRNEYTLKITGLVDELTRLYLEYCVDHSMVIREDVAISLTNFPDDNFRAYILKEIDLDKDGFLSEREIAEVKEVYVSGKNIEWLDGIEFFTSLEYLNCSDNDLSDLDVSKNLMLQELRCYDNNLTSLTIGKNPNLETLLCWNNHLSELDTSGCPALDYLHCGKNNIDEFDFSGNPLLVKILQEYGPAYREEGVIEYLHPNDWGQSDETVLSYDRSTWIYSQGSLLYSPDKIIERKLEPVSIGTGESDGGIMYNVELGSNTPIWIPSLLSCGKNTYKTSNPKVVKVDNKKGSVTGVKTGKATVKVISSLGVEISRQVIVKKSPSRISLSKSKSTMNEGDRLYIKVKLTPGTAARRLIWKTSNSNVAYYDEDGYIYADSPGTATITVKTYNGKKATCKVTVIDPSVPTKVKLNKSGTVKLKKGKRLRLKATVTPSTAETTLSWKSSKAKVATVTQDGLVAAKKKGTTTITVMTENGKTAKVKIKVV